MSEEIRPYYSLQAWQVSMQLVTLVYRWSNYFPSEEKFGLLSQIRRSAVSVPSNIAEGAARSGSREFVHFLSIARGSLSEVETQYLITLNLGFASESAELFDCTDQASRLITGLHKYHMKKCEL